MSSILYQIIETGSITLLSLSMYPARIAGVDSKSLLYRFHSGKVLSSGLYTDTDPSDWSYFLNRYNLEFKSIYELRFT